MAALPLKADLAERIGRQESDEARRRSHSPGEALLAFVVIAVHRLYDRYVVDSRVMRAYGQNRGASDGGK